MRRGASSGRADEASEPPGAITARTGFPSKKDEKKIEPVEDRGVGSKSDHTFLFLLLLALALALALILGLSLNLKLSLSLSLSLGLGLRPNLSLNPRRKS